MYLYETSNTRKRRGLVGELGDDIIQFFLSCIRYLEEYYHLSHESELYTGVI